MTEVYLSLGSNLGDKRGNIARAIEGIGAGGARVLARSADYRSAPWGPVEQDWFVNACIKVETGVAPIDFLRVCLRIEQDIGRVRTVKWGPRTIDIDLLVWGDLAMATAELTLPHPFMFERSFVMVPLAEIAPDLVVNGVSVAAAAARLGCAGVSALD